MNYLKLIDAKKRQHLINTDFISNVVYSNDNGKKIIMSNGLEIDISNHSFDEITRIIIDSSE